jgi:hypothetical protein
MTQMLLIIGVASAVVFPTILLVDGALTPGYDPVYHTGSELSLGARGWIQIANFLQMGVGMLAFALGVNRALDTVAGPIFLAVFGLGSIVSGLFVPDALRGYPPGAKETVTRHGQIHDATGPIMFFAIFAAALTLAGRLEGGWQVYTMLNAVVGLAFTIWTAISFQRDSAKTGLVQRGLILVYLIWVALLGLHLA